MEPLSRSASPTLPDYQAQEETSNQSSFPRPGTPNPGGYTDAAWDFQVINEPEASSVDALVIDLTRIHISSEPQPDNAHARIESMLREVRQNQLAISNLKLLFTSYDHALSFIQKNSEFLTYIEKDTKNTILHICINLLKDDPDVFIPVVVMLTVLLESGANKEATNAQEKMPIELALEFDMPLIVELLAESRCSKETLLALACKYSNQALIEYLAKESVFIRPQAAPPTVINNNNNNNNNYDPSEGLLQKGKELGIEINKNPVNVYERIHAFYLEYPQLLTLVFEDTGNTVMHRAVEAFAKKHLLGIFELLALLELGANKNARNSAGKTPLDLAKEASSVIMVQLLEHEAPTKELLINLAIEHQLDHLAEWLLN